MNALSLILLIATVACLVAIVVAIAVVSKWFLLPLAVIAVIVSVLGPHTPEDRR